MAIRITKDAVQSIDIINTFQGEVSGYISGGREPTLTDVIDKFSFTADANATDVGDLTQARNIVAGQQV